MIKRLICAMFHWRHHDMTPWGIHHYYCRCLKCGREWDEYE
jgi:hypothetical protein